MWRNGIAVTGVIMAVLCAGSRAQTGARRITITISGLGLDHAADLRQDALDELERGTGIRADLIPTPGDSANQSAQSLRLLEAHSATPDVYVIDAVWPGALGAYLLDLRPWLDVNAGSHLPALLRNDIVHGRLVSLPFYLNVGMLYCRRDLLEKYGYRHAPGNWGELESMAVRIQRGERAAGNRDFWGYVWQGAAFEGLTCNALEWQASFGGGHIIEPDGTVSVNNPGTIRALRQATRWVGKISPASVLSYTEADSLNAFQSGNAAFLRYWSSGFPRARLRDRVQVALLPAGPRGRAQVMGGFQLAVSRYSAHPHEAARMVEFLTSSEVQLRRALTRGYLPTIPRLYDQPELSDALPQVAELRHAGLESWVARPSTVSGAKYAQVSKAYYQTVHDVLSRKTEAEEAVARLEQQLIELTGFRAGAPQQ
jgi:trehalose/maltose transport system substrate-binding protein